MKRLPVLAALAFALSAGTASASSHREAPNLRGRQVEPTSLYQQVVSVIFGEDQQTGPVVAPVQVVAPAPAVTVRRPGYTPPAR